MKTFIAFSFIIALTACTQSAYQQPRLNGPGTQYEKWQTQTLENVLGKQLQLL